VRGVTLPDLNDEFAKMTGAAETFDALKEVVAKDVEARSQADYDDKYFVDLIEIVKEGATIKYHQHEIDHEGEHVLEDLSQRLAQQGMDLEAYFKVRKTTREKFIEEEVNPVSKKRFERSLILDEIVRREEIELKNEELDVEFNQTMNNLAMQGVDFGKIGGGRKAQERMAQSIAMEAASRVMTRRALDTIKSIAIGEYQPPEKKSEVEPVAEVEATPEAENTPEVEAAPETESTSSEEKTE
jgi:FKBP-type peptidyl-prolyl cis-trans isomerase (trigger factor)